jgi:hypothetical protein
MTRRSPAVPEDRLVAGNFGDYPPPWHQSNRATTTSDDHGTNLILIFNINCPIDFSYLT